MNFPPFPSQALAKLVLGYLAEEHLMTAYDEFLQASPYLDAYENEYDRIFMTSLKNILAEYRAVKIYVETCRPFHLRRKLTQCSNLLDMVKFLIQNVDIGKITSQEQNLSKSSVEKQNTNDKVNCEVCVSFKLETCSCGAKSSIVSSGNSKEQYEDNNILDSSVETTALSDLPGNHVTERKKNVCISDSTTSDSNVINNQSTRLQNSNVGLENTVTNNSMTNRVNSTASQSNVLEVDTSLVPQTDRLQVEQKEEFNNILHQVCHQNRKSSNIDKLQPLMGSYTNFATGVTGGATGTIIVPDTSTSEKVYLQIPVIDNNIINNPDVVSKMKQTGTQYLLKVALDKNNSKSNEILTINNAKNSPAVPIAPKRKSRKVEKVKILSDVKVDSTFNNNAGSLKMPQVLKNATSTPLVQMQTVVINGTPVYKQMSNDHKYNYTMDEIMAMPTIILAPTPGTSPNTVCSILSEGSNQPVYTSQTNIVRSLSPLTIDVSNEQPNQNTETDNHTTEEATIDEATTEEAKIEEATVEDEKNYKVTTDVNVPKTFDVTSASAPKDNTVTGTSETSTPQVLPPIRKSSSTPRRTSHVRVLDFATPRRILHESKNKYIATSTDVEKEVSKSSEVKHTISVIKSDEKDIVCDSSEENKMNKTVISKKNWDAELRALAVLSDLPGESQTPNTTSKPKPVKKKKETKSSLNKKESAKPNKEKSTKRRSTKEKSTMAYVPEPSEAENIIKVSIPVKPTIKIISGDRNGVHDIRTDSECDKTQNKSNPDNVDTPEMERMSLQHEIGAKLNISDILETPFKQALYDIQMETPRFLGPDLPDDPMSDIKIMNIPTPKFLNMPTPSSYSSRPTDYSSGGSYYKPDDLDYMGVSDDLICPVTSSVSKESMKSDLSTSNREVDSSDSNEKNNEKPTRPVRKCTKNISYYSSPVLNAKIKDGTDKTNTSISNITDSSFYESNSEKERKYTDREKKAKSQNKSDQNRSAKKRKTPVKKDTSKTFMKIKPRRPTPKKDVGKRKKKTPERLKIQGRKNISKQEEEKVGATPVIASAPTKSRRKSSTPRKLNCTKTFNSESSGHESPELMEKAKENICGSNLMITHESDTEQLPLRWSDDGSQDVKSKEVENNSVNETEDISKIQEYLKNAAIENDLSEEGCLHIDLVKRGFDLETAKIIERDLLHASPHSTQDFATKRDIVPEVNIGNMVATDCVVQTKNDVVVLEKTLESDCSTSNNLQIVQDDEEQEGEEEVDEIELSVHECNQDTENFFTYYHDDTKDFLKKEITKLRDKFSMEVCLDEDVSIRLRATPFTLLLDQDPDEIMLNYNQQETDMAVRSISNIDTPLKQSIKDQCYEIFDSTLTSLDTPLKARSPKFREEVTVTEIVLEVENLEVREKVDMKKRKRAQSGNLSDENESKKAKPEAQYLLNSANIQNIDIESVLSKLHGS